ncbi:PqiC family protein [Paraburkholderia rhizosphaerae]|uniref:ABC-type transport auxiliary lipoprotein component domain-containing protein n=1 Tax=Paraburkholderia rhizosphaerae TaxID=480658 RepID=A0A4R8LJK2_9BURK|nr:PqiC family protein [Paraburkholderia rhizosphaerae]TDY42648.1 hypothetical protein BX592_1209 [Paraburkholderia rhizosphaerae]
MKRSSWLIMSTLSLLLAGGCAHGPSGGVYTLNSEQLRQKRDLGIPLSIVVDYVAVPEVVDRPELVLRINPEQVRVVESARWSEPLKAQIATVLAIDLKRLLRSAPASDAHTADRPTVRIALNVRAFDATPGKGAVLSVGWSILTPDFKRVLNGRSIVIQRVDRNNYDALVDAQSRALAEVSADIADAIMSAFEKKPRATGRIFNVRSNRFAPSLPDSGADTLTTFCALPAHAHAARSFYEPART